ISTTPSGLTATQRSSRVLRARLRGREAVVILEGSTLAHLLARTTDRAQDPIVRTAATKMDVELGSDVCVRRRRIAVEPTCGAHDDAGQTVAALPRLLLDEGLLQRMKRCTTKPFDCRDSSGFRGRHRRVAGLNTSSIQQNCAASAHALSATEPS